MGGGAGGGRYHSLGAPPPHNAFVAEVTVLPSAPVAAETRRPSWLREAESVLSNGGERRR